MKEQGRIQDLSEGGENFFFDLKDSKRVKINDLRLKN